MSEAVRELISEADVDEKIAELGKKISEDYEGESVFLLCILKGGVFFTTELAKRIRVPVSLDFMSVSSYGAQTESSGVVRIVKDLDTSIEGKNVLVVEDIIDTGNTLKYLKEYFLSKNPKSLKICTLLDKPSRRQADVTGDYIGFTVEDLFIIGYGLDFDQKYRNLPYISYLE